MSEQKRSIEIRLLERKDMDAVLAIDALSTGHHRDEILKRRLERAFELGKVTMSLAAEWRGELVGYILGDVLVGEFGGTAKSATIDTLGVRGEFRSEGIARRLLRAFVNNARAIGVERVQTLVAVSNSSLLGFFSRAGFLHAQAVPLELDLGTIKPGQWDDDEPDSDRASREP